MKRGISTICNIASLLVILSVFDAWHALAMLLLAGQLPGTDIFLSPVDMLAACATASVMVILYATSWDVIKAAFFAPAAPAKKKSTRRRSHLA